MWPIAIVAGIVVIIAGGYAAERLRRAGRQASSVLVHLLRWAALAASVAVAFALSRHEDARTRLWLALAVAGAVLAVQAAFLAVFTIYRVRRTAAAPPRRHEP